MESLPVNVSGTWTLEEVSRTYRAVPVIGEVDEYRCPMPGAAYGDNGNLITRTVTYWNTNDVNKFGKTRWQVHADGTATLYAYTEDQNGVLTNITTQVGQPNSALNPTTILYGSQKSATINSLGQTTLIVGQAITNGTSSFITDKQSISYSGNLQETYTVVDLANRTNQYNYACCGLDNIVDPEGVTTQFDYDIIRRRVADTIYRGGAYGLKTTNALDALGRTIVTQRIGTNGTGVP